MPKGMVRQMILLRSSKGLVSFSMKMPFNRPPSAMLSLREAVVEVEHAVRARTIVLFSYLR